MDQRIGGIALVDVTVGVDGKVRDVLLAKSLDAVHGLDDAALAAAARWTFSPGTLNGQPVPVRVRLDLAFNHK
jgi:TonB family protein